MRVFIDVREPSEFLQDHVRGAVNVPPASLMSGSPELRDIPNDAELILYCRSGARSNSAMQFLRAQGFTNLTNGINQQHVESKYLAS